MDHWQEGSCVFCYNAFLSLICRSKTEMNYFYGVEKSDMWKSETSGTCGNKTELYASNIGSMSKYSC